MQLYTTTASRRATVNGVCTFKAHERRVRELLPAAFAGADDLDAVRRGRVEETVRCVVWGMAHVSVQVSCVLVGVLGHLFCTARPQLETRTPTPAFHF